MTEQAVLLEMPESKPGKSDSKDRLSSPKIKRVDRSQAQWVPLDLESSIGPDHKARAIWTLSGKLDLSPFYSEIRSQEGLAGRQHNDPRLLISLWLYAYSEGISSARELSRVMEYEPGLRWLAGLQVVNHTTLSDFRKDYRIGLDKVFAELLAVLEGAGLVSLDRVMHDGTKVQAQASGNSFRREKKVSERLKRAREVVAELSDPDDEEKPSRRQALLRRAAEEQVERLESALKELEKIRSSKHTAEEKEKARVSITEPEARMMKHGNGGGISPSYNLQITTDAKNKIIIKQDLTNCSSDSSVSLLDVVNELEASTGSKPTQVVADGGFTIRKNIIELADAGVDFIGSPTDREVLQYVSRQASGIAEEFTGDRFQRAAGENALLCPAGKRLKYVQMKYKDGSSYEVFKAQGSDCSACEFHQQCCPKGFQKGRTVHLLKSEPPQVTVFREKMKTETARQAYKDRAPVAEFPNAWIKEKFGIRKFRLRGLAKAGIEALWSCLTYNVMQWVRLVWRPTGEAVMQSAG